MTDIFYDHPFYLVGALVSVAMFLIIRSLRDDVKHNHHEYRTKRHDRKKDNKPLQ